MITKDFKYIIKSLTIARLSNYLKLVLSYFVSVIFRKNLLRGLPFSLSLEPTSYCNLNCPHCPTGNGSLKRDQGSLSMEHFKKVIDENENNLMYLILYFQGEPFLNHDIHKMISYARSKNIYVLTSTNAHHINPEMAKALVESGLNKIIISLDGMTDESYSAYRINGHLEKVKASLENLLQARKTANSSIPFIEVQFLVLKTNEHEIEKVSNYCKELNVDKLSLKSAQIYDFENDTRFIPKNKKFSRYIYVDKKIQKARKSQNRCFKMWTSAAVTWDGILAPCCFDKDATFNMGNVFVSEFKHVWESEKYQVLRTQLLKKRSSIDMCNNCSE
ncbi:MAG: radical SAM/SPASM domain-containing protein [Bacteroidales bacterium]|nr:radical SAM/SPASM domain-containing protein [Bacteroidales bacterium]